MTNSREDLLRARIKALEATDPNGVVTPRKLWESALDPADPLHEFFEWDDQEAAASWRDHQARNYISSVRVTIVTETVEIRVPEYVRDQQQPPDRQGYVSLQRVKTSEDRSRETVLAEFRRADACLTRARAVAAALQLEEEIDKIRNPLPRLLQALEPAADSH
mgnify:FL=1